MDELLSPWRAARARAQKLNLAGDALICPECGGCNLHHVEADIFARKEDAVTGARFRAQHLDDRYDLAPEISTSTDLSGNPSDRRGGILVRLVCEQCPGLSLGLTIAQHKGQTIVKIDATPPECTRRLEARRGGRSTILRGGLVRMILAIVTGSLFKRPEEKTSKGGKTFVAGTVKVMNGETLLFIRFVAFSESAQAELMRLGEGDAITVQGPFKAELYAKDGEQKISLSIVADRVLALRYASTQLPNLRTRALVKSALQAHGLQGQGQTTLSHSDKGTPMLELAGFNKGARP